MMRSFVRYASKKAAPIEKIDPLPYFKIEEPNATLPRIQGLKHSDLNLRNHPNFKKDRLQLLAALDLEHRQRADPLGVKSKLLDPNSPDALRIGDTITVETIRSRSYPRSSTITGICNSIVKSGYTSSVKIEAVIMGTTVNIQYKVYSPLVKSITLVKRAEKVAEISPTALNGLSLSAESIEEEPSMSSFLKQIFQRGSENLDAVGAAAPISMLEPLSALEQVSRVNGKKFAQMGGETPLERCKSVLSFFMDSAMVIPSHAGRKPINPIICEVFSCAYVSHGEWTTDAPVQILIEQVSHHPPINCMRAYSKTSNVYLESTQHFDFRLGKGLYFVLDNKGSAKVYLENWKEVYDVKLPNFIITPKMTMNGTADIMITGKMTIESTSGIVGEVKYEEKSFLKSLGSSVSGFLAMKNNEKSPLVTIEGDWKSQVYFNESSKKTVFCSGEKCPRLNGYTQVVRKDQDLEPTHTYKVWNQVTDSMKAGDLKSARKRKGKLEHWQRDYLKRNEKDHKPTYFKKTSGRWTWDPPSKEVQDIFGPPIE